MSVIRSLSLVNAKLIDAVFARTLAFLHAEYLLLVASGLLMFSVPTFFGVVYPRATTKGPSLPIPPPRWRRADRHVRAALCANVRDSSVP